jgi:hypothetical protein
VAVARQRGRDDERPAVPPGPAPEEPGRHRIPLPDADEDDALRGGGTPTRTTRSGGTPASRATSTAAATQSTAEVSAGSLADSGASWGAAIHSR